MELRSLNKNDAKWMLEWMHDDDVVHDLHTDFSKKTLQDCLSFIDKSANDTANLNLAIVDDMDVYMGTVSLKHIDIQDRIAEFAITVRKSAMGKGYSLYGMKKILEIAKEELGLEKIYWCVSPKNLRAIRFYEKQNFSFCDEVPENLLCFYQENLSNNLIWFCTLLK